LNRFATLTDRERRALVLAVSVVLAALAYLLVLAPLQRDLALQRTGLEAASSLHQRIKRLATESKALRAAAAGSVSDDGRSLLAVVDDTARTAGLAKNIGEMSRDGQDQVRLTVDQVGFDALMRWLVLLDRKHRVTTERITVSAGEKPGEVRATLTLRGNHQ
jgi:type II secretory pathway component PulM